MDGESSIWIFGYGSLTWNPGFEYNDKLIGHIQGYERRFWQGNVTHRGTPQKPGRVASLVKSNSKSQVWGVAYELCGNQIIGALGHLTNREKDLGGYVTTVEKFYCRSGDPYNVLVYTATDDNQFYLGPCNMATMVSQIISAHGPSGSNIEYVLRLAEFVREHIPEDNDFHLFMLEKYIQVTLKRMNLNRTSHEHPIPLTYPRFVDVVRT